MNVVRLGRYSVRTNFGIMSHRISLGSSLSLPGVAILILRISVAEIGIELFQVVFNMMDKTRLKFYEYCSVG